MTAASIVFEFPPAWQIGLPLATALVAGTLWLQARRGMSWGRAVPLALLRATVLGLLIFLAARPVRLARAPLVSPTRPVMVLMDRSQSMSLADQDQTRYQLAYDFMRRRLLPALQTARLPVQAMLFDQGAEPADGAKLGAARPTGKRTNLAGAIVQAMAAADQPPLAVIALTDGAANDGADDPGALDELTRNNVPFIGIGFGSDQGARTLALRNVIAPATISIRTAFNVSAQIEVVNGADLPAFDVLLVRDGHVAQKRTITPGKGSRDWLETFQVSEAKPGLHHYTVQLLPPNVPGLKSPNLLATTSVRVSNEKELRVLYIQGALTWDYKFIRLALRGDPDLKLTGLTRTSEQSLFRQNVEDAGELLNGFPTSLAALAPFRVIVLSNLRPADLTPQQQEILARFCGDLGGGLLLIGGQATFDSSWKNSRLEALLPVTFAADTGIQGLDRPFHLQLTQDALRHPVFQLDDTRPATECWAKLPAFTQYGRVDEAKPAAQVWAVHQTDDGPHGRRILMAVQRYGAGLSAVLCLQNFWRWRLAKDSDPVQFDRFWRQLLRYLSEVGRQEISINLPDQELHPGMDVQVVLQRQPNPQSLLDTNRQFVVRVTDSKTNLLHEESLDLATGQPLDFRFHAANADVYTVTVLSPAHSPPADPSRAPGAGAAVPDAQLVPVAARPIEIHEVNIEFESPARDMETLRQWASVSDGLAFKAEECPKAADLVAQIIRKAAQVPQSAQVRRPLGLNAWMLGLLLGCLGGEWLLRKRWHLV